MGLRFAGPHAYNNLHASRNRTLDIPHTRAAQPPSRTAAATDDVEADDDHVTYFEPPHQYTHIGIC